MSVLVKTTIEGEPYVKVSDVIKRLENMQKKERRIDSSAATWSRVSRIQSLINDLKRENST